MEGGGAMQEAMIRAYLALGDLTERARRPLSGQAGQTAAEYLGIIAVIAVVIGALAATDIGGTIGGFILDLAQEIFDGGR
jgi:pilus assembly protein Flp/PilA